VTEPRCGTVAIVGRAGVGKSTLLNALVGEKIAIASPVPQTTRNRILGVKNRPEGQIVYLDTPGFHKPKYRLNRDMVGIAESCLRDADLLLWVIDAAEGIGPGDRYVLSLLRRQQTPVVVALNKIDRLRPPALLPLLDALRQEGDFAALVPVSAVAGTQCEELEQALLPHLPEHPPLFPEEYLTDQPERWLAAEMIREQLFLLTREEIPHASAVSVERFAELRDGSVRIEATLLVERESHKRIVVGRGGKMLKEIGSRARAAIADRFGRPAAVFLWVSVQPRWRQDEGVLRRLREQQGGGGVC
jgi:GTP-binding protein Era